MRSSFLAILWGLTLAVTGVSAQEATPEAPVPEAPAPETPAPEAPAPEAPAPANEQTTAQELQPAPKTELKAPPDAWTGPRVEIAYRIYSLSGSGGGGAVNSASFAGFLPTRMVRAGGGLEAGGRAYEYGPTEGLLSGHVFAGYQHLHDLGRVVPYVVALGELGVLIGKRFHTPVTNMVRGAGIEIGADVNVVRSFYLGLGLSYMVYTIDDLSYDTFGLRLSMGL